MASPSFKHGGRSKYVPARYLEVVQSAMADPDLMSVHLDFALAEARNVELLQAIDHGSSLEAWRAARQMAADLRKAAGPAPSPAIVAALDQLDEVLGGGIAAADGERHAWRELRNNMRVRARLVEVERRRQEQLGSMMPAEQVMALVGRVAAIVSEHIPDPKTRQRLADELMALGGAFENSDEPGPHGAF